MAAVLLSNPGLPLAVLGNPRRSVMSKRTPHFFLRRFKRGKRNPYYHHAGYSAGGSLVSSGTAPRYAKSRAALRDALEAEGISVSNITPVLKTGKSKRRHRRLHRKHTKAHRAKRPHMKKAHRRSSVKRRLAALRRHAKILGRVFKRKVRGRKYAIKVLHVRKGRGTKRKIHAVRWSGRKGSKIYTALSFGSRHKKGTHVMGFTNPRRRKHRARRSTSRRNPGIAAEYLGGLTTAPRKAMSLFKGPGMAKHLLYTAGGAVGSFMVGGIFSSKVLRPLLEKIAPTFAAQAADPSTIQARLVGGALPYTTAFLITKLFGKKLGADVSSAVLLGGAVASIIELLRPGMVGDALKKVGLGQLPYAGPALAGLGALSGPVCGLGYSDQLAEYVEAASYQGAAGMRGYEQAPAYQGSAGIAGYVADRSMRVSGLGREVLAGTFLDDASTNMLTNDWLNNEDNSQDASTNDAMAVSQ